MVLIAHFEVYVGSKYDTCWVAVLDSALQRQWLNNAYINQKDRKVWKNLELPEGTVLEYNSKAGSTNAGKRLKHYAVVEAGGIVDLKIRSTDFKSLLMAFIKKEISLSELKERC